MSRQFFVGYHAILAKIYLNVHGQALMDKNAPFIGERDKLNELVGYFADNYDGKKGFLKTDLPPSMTSELELLVKVNQKLRKIKLDINY